MKQAKKLSKAPAKGKKPAPKKAAKVVPLETVEVEDQEDVQEEALAANDTAPAPAPVKHEKVAPVVAAQEDESNDEDFRFNKKPGFEGLPKETTGEITLNLSSQLLGKLKYMAREEGINVESLIQEFLAESVVLRAWEIIERKSAMRGGNQQQQGGGNNNNNRFGGGNNNNRHRNNRNNNQRRGGGGGGGNWMEDKAAFLEYVRNQEKRRR